VPQINKSQFANLAGVSRTAIGKAVDSGAVICKNGKIDIDHPTNKAYLGIDRSGKKRAKQSVIIKPEKQEEEKTGDVVEERKPVVSTGKLKSRVAIPDKYMSKTDADIARIQVVIAKEKVNLAKNIGTVILRESVGKLFGGLHSIILNYFFPLSDRLTPIIGGICGVSDPAILLKVKKEIDKEVMRGLSEFKREAEKGI
jgi:hypothetical protein